MKKILFIIFILITGNITAQSPMGGGMGGNRPPRGGGRGEGRPPMQQRSGNQDDFMIMGMPDIPDLALEQREKLSKAISEERKDISKLIKEKQDYKRESDNPGIAGKERAKLLEKAEKTDDKIRKKEEKYEKKYRSILSEEQYQIFSEKKKDIEFRGHGRQGERPNKANRQQPPQIPNENMAPDMPDNDMF
ncbi:MAG: hypothetical protein ACK5KL_01430 [Dysgonomonas sp.]